MEVQEGTSVAKDVKTLLNPIDPTDNVIDYSLSRRG